MFVIKSTDIDIQKSRQQKVVYFPSHRALNAADCFCGEEAPPIKVPFTDFSYLRSKALASAPKIIIKVSISFRRPQNVPFSNTSLLRRDEARCREPDRGMQLNRISVAHQPFSRRDGEKYANLEGAHPVCTLNRAIKANAPFPGHLQGQRIFSTFSSFCRVLVAGYMPLHRLCQLKPGSPGAIIRFLRGAL